MIIPAIWNGSGVTTKERSTTSRTNSTPVTSFSDFDARVKATQQTSTRPAAKAIPGRKPTYRDSVTLVGDLRPAQELPMEPDRRLERSAVEWLHQLQSSTPLMSSRSGPRQWQSVMQRAVWRPCCRRPPAHNANPRNTKERHGGRQGARLGRELWRRQSLRIPSAVPKENPFHSQGLVRPGRCRGSASVLVGAARHHFESRPGFAQWPGGRQAHQARRRPPSVLRRVGTTFGSPTARAAPFWSSTRAAGVRSSE